jgi:NADH-quinone oxidoreductase subunit C
MASRDRISAEHALAKVQGAVSEMSTKIELNHDQVDVTCSTDNLVQVMTALRDTEGLLCHFFTFLSAIDRSSVGGGDSGEDDADDKGKERTGLEVLVHVYSPQHVVHVNVHVPVDMEVPECPSITSIYSGAHWHERETWEMFGIHFVGHPRLVNLYLPEDFEGHPMLKSFKLPSRAVKDWPGAKDPEEAAAGGR